MLSNSLLQGLDAADAPTLARAEAIETGAAAFFTFARRVGVRFDLTRKVEDATEYSIREGGSTFAIPTKLSGTSGHQPALAAFGAIPHKYRKLTMRQQAVAGRDRIALYFGGDRLGFVQDKHAAWLLPLLSWGRLGTPEAGQGVEVYALQVTGGEPERPTRGLNVVITGAGERALLLLERTDFYRAEAAAEAELERQAEEAAMMGAAERGHEVF